MRRDTTPPEIPAVGPWAIATAKAMRYIRIYGYRNWLEKEAATPTLADDPDWIAFIAHERGQGPAPRFHERQEDLENVQTFRCARCRDKDWETTIDVTTGKLYTRRCEACRARRDAEIRAAAATTADAGDRRLEERRKREEDEKLWD